MSVKNGGGGVAGGGWGGGGGGGGVAAGGRAGGRKVDSDGSIPDNRMMIFDHSLKGI